MNITKKLSIICAASIIFGLQSSNLKAMETSEKTESCEEKLDLKNDESFKKYSFCFSFKPFLTSNDAYESYFQDYYSRINNNYLKKIKGDYYFKKITVFLAYDFFKDMLSNDLKYSVNKFLEKCKCICLHEDFITKEKADIKYGPRLYKYIFNLISSFIDTCLKKDNKSNIIYGYFIESFNGIEDIIKKIDKFIDSYNQKDIENNPFKFQNLLIELDIFLNNSIDSIDEKFKDNIIKRNEDVDAFFDELDKNLTKTLTKAKKELYGEGMYEYKTYEDESFSVPYIDLVATSKLCEEKIPEYLNYIEKIITDTKENINCEFDYLFENFRNSLINDIKKPDFSDNFIYNLMNIILRVRNIEKYKFKKEYEKEYNSKKLNLCKDLFSRFKDFIIKEQALLINELEKISKEDYDEISKSLNFSDFLNKEKEMFFENNNYNFIIEKNSNIKKEMDKKVSKEDIIFKFIKYIIISSISKTMKDTLDTNNKKDKSKLFYNELHKFFKEINKMIIKELIFGLTLGSYSFDDINYIFKDKIKKEDIAKDSVFNYINKNLLDWMNETSNSYCFSVILKNDNFSKNDYRDFFNKFYYEYYLPLHCNCSDTQRNMTFNSNIKNEIFIHFINLKKLYNLENQEKKEIYRLISEKIQGAIKLLENDDSPYAKDNKENLKTYFEFLKEIWNDDGERKNYIKYLNKCFDSIIIENVKFYCLD